MLGIVKSRPLHPEQRPEASEGPPRRRRLASAAIATYLAIQIALPASYYVAGDPRDERFAWRMFSSRRFTQCDVSFETSRGTVRVDELGSEIHSAWIELAERGRPAVLRAIARRLCEDRGGPVVTRVTCTFPDGALEPARDEPVTTCPR